MNKIALLLLLFALSGFSQQANLALVPADSLRFAADDYAGADGYGFYYFIKNNVFIKTDGVRSLEFGKNALGKITRADIANPLLIVLFYENFNTAVLLDNQLNEVKEIDFSKLETPVVARAVGMASQNKLWVYDSLTQRLGLYDYLKNMWQPVTTPLTEPILFYQTDFNNFQWIDAKSVWYASDIFGKIQTLGKMPGFDAVYFASGTAFFYSQNTKLYLRDLKNNSVYRVVNLDNSPKKFYYKDQILAIFTGSGITNYKITLP